MGPRNWKALIQKRDNWWKVVEEAIMNCTANEEEKGEKKLARGVVYQFVFLTFTSTDSK